MAQDAGQLNEICMYIIKGSWEAIFLVMDDWNRNEKNSITHNQRNNLPSYGRLESQWKNSITQHYITKNFITQHYITVTPHHKNTTSHNTTSYHHTKSRNTTSHNTTSHNTTSHNTTVVVVAVAVVVVAVVVVVVVVVVGEVWDYAHWMVVCASWHHI